MLVLCREIASNVSIPAPAGSETSGKPPTKQRGSIRRVIFNAEPEDMNLAEIAKRLGITRTKLRLMMRHRNNLKKPGAKRNLGNLLA